MSASRPLSRRLCDWVVRADDANGVRTIVVSGELDLCAADELAATLAAEYSDGGEIRVDLTGVTFIDAPILGVLVRADQHLREQAGRLVLTGSGKRIKRLLHITGLDDLLAVEQVA